jgi:hypothetical protein
MNRKPLKPKKGVTRMPRRNDVEDAPEPVEAEATVKVTDGTETQEVPKHVADMLCKHGWKVVE